MSQGESTVVCDANVSIPGVVSAKVEEERERETQVAKMNCRQTDRVESITGLNHFGLVSLLYMSTLNAGSITRPHFPYFDGN